MFKIIDRCDFCKSRRNKIIHNFNKQQLVRCSKCKLAYLNKQFINISEIYENDYYCNQNNNKANYFDYRLLNQKALFKNNFGFSYRFIDQNSKKNKKYRLLDIGAGFGYFIKYLPEKINAEVVEISKMAGKELRKEKIKTIIGDFTAIKLREKYDFITAFDVMEHQNNLSQFLQKTKSLLTKNGYFLFSVPDYGSIFNKILGKKAPAIQLRYHNYYFDKIWFQNNLPKLGWEIISLKSTYFTKMTINHLAMMASFIFPDLFQKKIIRYLLKQDKISNKVIPFIRAGGIEGIIKKSS